MSSGGRGLRARIAARRWDLQRFGVTPTDLYSRARPGDGPKVLCNTIPKSGTHLLERALCLHPDLYRKLLPTLFMGNVGKRGGIDGVMRGLKPNQVIVGHLPSRAEVIDSVAAAGVKTAVLLRDPRDIVVSTAHYIANSSGHKYHGLFKAQPDFRSRLEVAINGRPRIGFISIGERLGSFDGWLEAAAVVVRFEDLIGSRGGGGDDAQAESIRRVFVGIDVDHDDALVASIASQLFSSDSPTFRKGASRQWTEHFDDEIEAMFMESAGKYLERFDYV